MKILNVKREYKTTAMAESESVVGAFYMLNFENGRFTCTCPSHSKAGNECKHLIAFKEELEYMKSQREDHANN